ncbi:MAG TPA: hypothetical protein VMU95_37260 [Trebonia sp.]|nr:hypothetical protein [Trebonia sp.]
MLLATRCACGFERQEDEEVIDHLLELFDPEDAIGADGQAHMEMAYLACACGFKTTHGADLDYHFLVVFTPPGQVGTDGRRHEPTTPLTV